MIRGQMHFENRAEVENSIIRLSANMVNAVLEQAERELPMRIADLRQTISKVVYQAYTPKVYRRRADVPLIQAVSGIVTPTPKGVDMTLGNESSKIVPRPRPVGGSRLQQVPFEIEEGTYPEPFQRRKRKGAWIRPRPAYGHYARQLDREIERWTGKIIDRLLK